MIVTISYFVLTKKYTFSRFALLLFCAALLPLAINCMYLITREEAVHTLVLYSYICVYIVAAVLVDAVMQNKTVGKDIVLACLIWILGINIYSANKEYLRMHVAYENAYSFYTTVITQIKQTPGFDSGKKVAIIGHADNWTYDTEGFGKNRVQGVQDSLINIYSREKFIQYYIGFDVPFASEGEKEWIETTQEYQRMEEYPWYGSVQIIDDFVVVKLGSEDP